LETGEEVKEDIKSTFILFSLYPYFPLPFSFFSIFSPLFPILFWETVLLFVSCFLFLVHSSFLSFQLPSILGRHIVKFFSFVFFVHCLLYIVYQTSTTFKNQHFQHYISVISVYCGHLCPIASCTQKLVILYLPTIP
jgi:hypothetical protein